MSGLFARHTGRHCRRRFHRAADASPSAPVVDDFSRTRMPALAPPPMAADDLIPFADYRHPYSPKDTAA